MTDDFKERLRKAKEFAENQQEAFDKELEEYDNEQKRN